jgi:hypothetical protein
VRLVFTAVWAICCLAASDDQQFNGRWNITVNLKGKFVGAPGGQLDDIPRLSISDGEMRFAFERRYNREQKNPQKGIYYARIEEGKLKGTFEIEGDPSSYLEWSGVRAPALPDRDDGSWKKGEPVSLFDGHDLMGWLPQIPLRPLGWSVKDGMLINSAVSNNLVSEKKFWNFILHTEFRIGPRSNSGIGLRGRYELQIVDDFDRPPSIHGSGAIFDRIAPTMNAGDLPGEWQSIDVRLVGRQVTIVLNGVKVIDKQTIDGLTAIAMSANEAEPGPITIQGDRGPIEIRKMIAYPLTK